LKLRVLLAAAVGVAATAAATAVGAGVPASAATGVFLPGDPSGGSSGGPPGGPPLHVISGHRSLEQALPDATAERIAGIVPPAGQRVTARAAAASGCTEPNCDVSYNSGPVQHAPHVYLLLWGPGWSASSAAYSYLKSFYGGLGMSPRDTWSAVTSQYGDGSGHPGFASPVFEGAWKDTSAPPASVTPADLAAEADWLVGHLGLTGTGLAGAQVVVASQPGSCFSDGFVGSCGKLSKSGSYCAWHSYSGTVSFTNLPYLLDAGTDCGEHWINKGSAGTYDGFSMVAGHEYAESITDPQISAWYDPADTISGGEIADKCAWGGAGWSGGDPEGDVTLSTGRFAMQSLWSNVGGRCVMSPVVDHVRITRPGSQHATLGKAVRLRVRARSTTGAVLSFKAARLPDGLSISSSGLITGKPRVTAGTWRPVITVTDSRGSAASAAFAWYVGSKAGPVRGYASKCADDYAGRTRNGTKIDLWACDSRARQRLTFTASGELRVAGRCVTAKRGAVLEPCARSGAQTWTRRADGEYVVRSDGRCLTDPRYSRANGTRLRLSACSGRPDQRWSLPGAG
jgi:hypothetical protein